MEKTALTKVLKYLSEKHCKKWKKSSINIFSLKNAGALFRKNEENGELYHPLALSVHGDVLSQHISIGKD